MLVKRGDWTGSASKNLQKTCTMKTLVPRLLVLFTLLLSSLPGLTLAEEPSSETLALPVLKQGEALPKSRWDVDGLFEQLLGQLPDFLGRLPQNVKRVTLLNLEGDPSYDLNANRLSYRLLNSLVAQGRLEMVECRQCSNLKIYVDKDSLVLAKSLESNEQYQALGRQLKIDAYLQGFLEMNEREGRLTLNLKLVRTEDGSVVNTASFSVKAKEEDKGLANPADRPSHIGLALSPFVGFGYQGWVLVNNQNTEKKVTSFTGVTLRLLTPTFWETIDLGLDLDSFSASTSTETATLKLSAVQAVPLVRYQLPFRFGFGGAAVNSETSLATKAGAEFFINNNLSVGLDYYQLGSRKVQSDLKDSEGNFLTNKFSGSAMAVSFRFLY